jgi:hypothetical protein
MNEPPDPPTRRVRGKAIDAERVDGRNPATTQSVPLLVPSRRAASSRSRQNRKPQCC